MVELSVLDFRRNNFTGSLPPFCAQTDSLRAIVLNGNLFKEPVPVSLLNCVGLEVLDLGNDAINDIFPAWLGTLQELQVLILKFNLFHGPISDIPMEWGQLNMLEALDLSWNRLTGKIPQGLTRMNFLVVLKLFQNHLVAPIPHGPQFNTFENDSYGGNVDLCGPPIKAMWNE
ncbi:hypothetical protein R3W88_032667 [Solanum pinnatisectum]|uniref:Uncharacterized protein n=1 Tax=Solanum pinnatisectum TaxID=50273 RepID=A0AAV9LPT3_9SOLN|nr:hypothetical protein R3W88_032667 [Solanum pinnatisectum]